ncbi:YqeB family protein [Actinomadura chokoriensis]|uniref:YqeB family protein n=1 Tax=Actinomadura chokoriensis TaxID=454156 RepID=UPI0031F8313C
MRSHPDVSTTLARSAWAQGALYAGAAVLLAGVGWLLDPLANWLVGLEWAPMRGPAELLVSVPEPWLTIGLIAVGALAGAGLIFFDSLEQVSVTVSGERVILKRPGHVQEVVREQVGHVFREKDRLVLLGPKGEEIAREKCDLNVRRLAAVFTGYGYAWADGDPYEDEFRIWAPQTPELPDLANALLAARAQAMKSSDSGDSVKELRRELSRIGIVVRDKGKQQYWRGPGRR